METAWLVAGGWHTEIGLPVAALRGPPAWFRTVYPGADTVLFGYGKRTFMTARADDAAAYILGPFPGRAVIQTMALSVPPPRAFAPDEVVAIPLEAREMDRLARAIWADFLIGAGGRPELTAAGAGNRSLFYAARSRYGLRHDCNRWSCTMLHAAVPEVQPQGVLFAAQAMARARGVARRRCAGP